MLGAILLSVFLASLPWVWVNALPVAFNVRPAILAALPLVLYVVFKRGYRVHDINWRVLSFLIVGVCVWFLPSVFYEYPHWKWAPVFSVVVYGFIGYFAALAYNHIVRHRHWQYLWPLVITVSVISTCASFYMAFGSLVLNTSIASSSDIIFGTLYSGIFSGAEGKGIRHTMALVPVMLMALIFHNQSYSKKLNVILFACCLYLAFFTFSRSAWLAAFLVCLIVVRYLLINMGKNLGKYLVFSVILSIAAVVLLISNPALLHWVINIFTDRVADSASTEGRIWVIGHVLFDSSAQQWLLGFDQQFQQKPHNLILGSLMQSGILGFLIGLTIVYYLAHRYLRGLFKREPIYLYMAAFVTPGLVRAFTAGNGLLHIVEIFGICVAATILVSVNPSESGSVDHSQRTQTKKRFNFA